LAQRPPDVTHRVILAGAMAPYAWSLNGEYWPNVTPLVITRGQRVAIEMLNHTMMPHPMHSREPFDGTHRKRFNCTETEKQSMPAYLVYICQSVSDRKELETYWKDMPRTFIGFDVKLHTVYRPFELLEGEGPVEGVVVAEFPSIEEAKRWYDSPGYVAVRQHRMRGAKYLGLLVDGGVTESIDERMPQTRQKP